MQVQDFKQRLERAPVALLRCKVDLQKAEKRAARRMLWLLIGWAIASGLLASKIAEWVAR